MIKQTNKITALERSLAISKYSQLLQSIESGEWEYSPSKLKSDLEAFKLTTWVQVHPMWTALIFIMGGLLGLVPAVIFIAILAFSKTGRENYELAILKLKKRSI